MMYTNEERQKIHENLDKIKAYLDELRPKLREEVTVDFGPITTYANYTREKAYHITISKDGISCREGGLGYDFSKAEKSSWNTTAYTRMDFAVALIQNWFTVKNTVNTAIQTQNMMLEAINNFEI